jgi:type I restriction enzyme, S subunit
LKPPEFRPLGEVARLQAGVGFPLDLQGRATGDYPLAKVGDISRGGRSGCSVLGTADHFVDKQDLPRLGAKPIPKGSVLFAKIGEAIRQNHRVIAGCDLLVDNNAMAAIPVGDTVSEYLYHYLRTVDFYRLASATTVPALKKSELERLPVPWRGVSEQRRIADVLDRAEALRAKRRAALAQLDTLTQSIFLDLFGDPVRNPHRLELAVLGDLIKLKSGAFLPADGMAAGGQYPVLGGNGVNGFHDKYMFEEPQIVIGRVGAYCGCVHLSPRNCWVTDNALYVSECSPRLRTCYLTHALSHAKLNQYASQSGQPLVSGSRIYPVRILVPAVALQDEFANRIGAVEKLKAAQRRSLAELDALFASLQHRAFRGEL